MQIKKVGVVGCGLMGSGIAEVSARFGYDVVVREVDQDVLQRGLERIRASMAKAVERGKLSQAESETAFERIQGALSLEAFADCDLVVEAAVENLSLKKDIFAALDGICWRATPRRFP